jgi:site-specific recombinase XerD
MTPTFDNLIRGFFCCRLIEQQGVSQHTVESYRDTFVLLLAYLPGRLGKGATDLTLDDLDASNVIAFLDHLQTQRGNGPRTRNARLAALRSFARYTASRDPTALPLANRVLAIPAKRHDKPLLGFLTRQEVEAVLAAPDASTWAGQRDRVLFAVMYNTGARVSEAVGLRRNDLNTDQAGRSLCIRGKGRKERVIPLWKQTALVLNEWLRRLPPSPDGPLFPNARGRPLSRSGVEDRLEVAVKKASEACPSLRNKNVSPHTIRHTTAMHLLQAGVDLTMIALWLGHESPETTHQYVEADLKMKEEVLIKAEGVPIEESRYKPKPSLLDFLENL